MEKRRVPEHCKNCPRLADCVQAEYMNADTPAEPGYTDVTVGEYFCEHHVDCSHDCFPLDGEELDSPAHCAECGAPLSHDLTPDGVEYVKQAIAEGTGCCRELWPEVWRDWLRV